MTLCKWLRKLQALAGSSQVCLIKALVVQCGYGDHNVLFPDLLWVFIEIGWQKPELSAATDLYAYCTLTRHSTI